MSVPAVNSHIMNALLLFDRLPESSRVCLNNRGRSVICFGRRPRWCGLALVRPVSRILILRLKFWIKRTGRVVYDFLKILHLRCKVTCVAISRRSLKYSFTVSTL
jgi:hypothetical protein